MQYIGHITKHIWFESLKPPTAIEQPDLLFPDRFTAYAWHGSLGTQMVDENGRKYFYTGHLSTKQICETCNGEGSIDKDIEYPNGSIMSALVKCPDCD